jgi:membrane fusion protein (multidrug efflux system)
VAVPATAVVHAPYGDSVFLIEAEKAAGAKPGAQANAASGVKQVRQQFVRLGEERGDFVAVLDGIKPGQELVSAGAFKLRNGATITINNKSRPTPEVDPRPENR